MVLPLSDSPVRLDEGAIELGPRLPLAAYHAIERWHPDRIGALALYCSDGRWGEAMDEFCHRHLQIPRYDRWALPGGPAWVAGGPADAAVRAQLDFLVQAHELEQIVLITHYGCAWYGHHLRRPPPDCLAVQGEDLRAATDTLRGWYPGLRVDAYVAMRQHDWVTFHEWDTGAGQSRRAS